jgi:putative transposase
MSRPLRIAFPGAYYHVMNRGLAYQNIFSDRPDRLGFLGLLEECHRMWGMRVLAYCLLDNHYHLLIQTPDANLSRIMRHLDGIYTQRYNRKHGRDGPLFRGRYKAIVVDEEEYLLGVARYIHHNPVAAGLVTSPERYRWSSCREYLKRGKGPKWLDRQPLLDRFPTSGRREAFLTFMRSKLDEPVRAFYARRHHAPVLGSSRFIDRIRGRVKQAYREHREVPQAKTYTCPNAHRCLGVVTRVYGQAVDDLLRSERGRRNEARAMAMYVCRSLAGLKQGAIARIFGVRGYSAVSSAIRRVQRAIEHGGKIARRYRQVSRLLET